MPIERTTTTLDTSTSVNAALAMAQARQQNGMPRLNGYARQPEASDSDAPPKKHSQSTSITTTKTTVRARTSPAKKAETFPASSSSDHLSILGDRPSERAKSPFEQLQETIVQPLSKTLSKFSMVGTGRSRASASGSRSSLSPPPSLHNETFSSNTLDSIGENTTNDYSRLEQEFQAEQRSQNGRLARQPAPSHAGSRQSRMTLQTVTRNGTVRARNKRNMDEKAFVYTEEGMSEDDLPAAGAGGIGANLPLRSTRLANSQTTHTRPQPHGQNGKVRRNHDDSGSDVPSSLSHSDHKEDDVFGSGGSIRPGRTPSSFNRRAQQNNQRRSSGSDEREEIKHTTRSGDDSDEMYAREKAPFNRATPAMTGRYSQGKIVAVPKRQPRIIPTKKGPIETVLHKVGIDPSNGSGIFKLVLLALAATYLGFAAKSAMNDVKHTFGGLGGSVLDGPPPTGIDEAEWKAFHEDVIEQRTQMGEINGKVHALDKWNIETRNDIDSQKLELHQFTTNQRLQMDALNDQAEALKQEWNRYRNEFGNHQSGVMKELRRIELLLIDSKKNFNGDLTEVKNRLVKVETEMLKMFDEKLWRQKLEQHMPAFMPYQRDSNDRLVVDPVFWIEMKKMFAAETSVADSTRTVQPSWKDFIEENDDKLRTWLHESLGEASYYTNAMQKQHTQIALDEEIERLKASMLEEMKARAAEGEKLVKAELDKLRAEAREHFGMHKSEKVPDHVLMDSAFTVEQLIDHALLKYSKDTIAKADYALASGGGTILTHQTSPSLELERPGFLGRLYGRKALARAPQVALHNVNEPGYCWAFAGAKGTLGIGLSTRITATDITIEHVAKELVAEEALKSAPKTIEIWANPATLQEQSKIEGFLAEWPDHQIDRIAPSAGAILLTTIEYNPHTERPIQTFQVPHQLRELGVATDNIVAKFNDNWGSEYTCLYRIRVHGQPV